MANQIPTYINGLPRGQTGGIKVRLENKMLSQYSSYLKKEGNLGTERRPTSSPRISHNTVESNNSTTSCPFHADEVTRLCHSLAPPRVTHPCHFPPPVFLSWRCARSKNSEESTVGGVMTWWDDVSHQRISSNSALMVRSGPPY